MFLVDTAVISEARKGDKANAGVREFVESARRNNVALFLSAITIGELRQGVEMLRHRGDSAQSARLERFKDNGEPIRNLQYPWVRWRRTLQVTLKARYREPYNARHSSVTWNLMVGKNPLWVAKQHGHSVHTMLETYAAWIEGANDSDIEAIKQAMLSSSAKPIHRGFAIENVVCSAQFG